MVSYLFQDEFEGALGSAPNPTLWTHALDGEKVNSRSNSFLDGNSNLVIRVTDEGGGVYHSALVNTGGSVNFQSETPDPSFAAGKGTIWEARIKFNQQSG